MDDLAAPDDVSALAWVQGELRRSLEAAHKSLRRSLQEVDPIFGEAEAVDTAMLRAAKTQFHKGAGALALIGLPAGAAVLRAAESLLQRHVDQPSRLDAQSLDRIQQGSFAVLDFMEQRIAGQAVSPVALFPQYRALQELAGAQRIHPADLWSATWRWPDLPPEAGAEPRAADAQTTAEFESQVLGLMRTPGPEASRRLSDFSAGLAAGAGRSPTGDLWRLAAAFFEAQAEGRVPADLYAKRAASRLLAQLRGQQRDPHQADAQLARDLAFFCAHADPATAAPTPRLDALSSALPGGGHALPVDYREATLGRFDPVWVVQARKRVMTAREAWSAVAAGEMHGLPGLKDQFALVADSLQRLVQGGEVLGDALLRAALQVSQTGTPPSPALAMEVATSVLYLEAALEEGSGAQPLESERCQRLAQRIATVREGGQSEPLEAWMEALYRQVFDRETMGSVVQALRASLAESESLIDQFFRAPDEAAVLVPVPAQLQAMRGVLSVLGLSEATQAVLRMRDDVDALLLAGQAGGAQDMATERPRFERLAANLSALSALIDLFGVQPQAAKALFRYDPQEGLLQSLIGRRGVEPGRPEMPSGPELPKPLAGVEGPTAPERAAGDAPALAGVPDQDGDQELHDIFLEEAAEVIETAREAWATLKRTPDDVEQLTTVRRAFHTLKGSSRMVGLSEFGEAAWAFEQLYNAWLAGHRPASGELLAVTAQALDHLARWRQDIAEGLALGRSSAEARQVADALRLEDRLTGFESPAPAPVPEPEAPRAGPETPAAFDLDIPGVTDVGEVTEVFDVDALELSPPPPSVDLGTAMALRRLDLPAASDLDLLFEPGEAAIPVAETATWPPPQDDAAPQASHPGMDFSFDLDEPPSETPPEASPETLLESLPEPTEVVEVGGVVEVVEVERLADPGPAPEPWVEPAAEAAPAGGLSDAGLDSAPGFELAFPSSLPPTGDEAPAETLAPWASDVAGLPALDAARPAEDTLPVADVVRSEDEEPLDEQIKRVGPLEISIPLFNIYLNEADELSRRLSVGLSEWALELHRPVGETPVALAHSLAGSSAAVGFTDLSTLARLLEQALQPSHALGSGTPEDAALFNEVAEEMRRLLHQFAAGFLKSPSQALVDRLLAHGAALAQRLQRQTARAAEAASQGEGDAGPEADLGADESVDPALFAFFEEEAQDLLPEVAARLGDWLREPLDESHPTACLRALHTLKGGARLSGALRLGERAHRLEAAIEQLLAGGPPAPQDIEALLARADALSGAFEACRRLAAGGLGLAASPLAAEASPGAPISVAEEVLETEPRIETETETETAEGSDGPPAGMEPAPAKPSAPLAVHGFVASEGLPPGGAEAVPAPRAAMPSIDWSPFLALESVRPTPATERLAPLSRSAVRVRAQLLDRMVNQTGEVSIARARLASGLSQFRSSLGDLGENLERLRQQLRDIEIQADTQISARMEAAKTTAQAFDPLEFDRFTRVQELTRMMAESVNDVATVQRSLQRSLEGAEDQIAAQARLTRDLQDDLLRTRMVEFDGLAERLQRVVRQAAKETGKLARLEVVGGSIEVDRAVLDRMVASFEHLVRNAVTHGIERPQERLAAGKPETGLIRVSVHQEGNEVGVEIRDDGAGLDLGRILARGVAMGLIDEHRPHGEAEITQLIFHPGLSTADAVTELAGRGIGMDVVRHEVNALGGRIETTTTPGQGSGFRLVLPLTTAVTQVVMLRCGASTIAVPSTLVEAVHRATPEEIAKAHACGVYDHAGQPLPFFWLGALLENGARSAGNDARSHRVVVVRSAAQRVALHVDEVQGNQEVVVKHLGPQLSRLPGLAGLSLLPSGAVVLIYNPVGLAAVYADAARAAMAQAPASDPALTPAVACAPDLPQAPLVLVVDDSLTVRRVTQRLLQREGYRVALAKDGVDALERLAEERPAVVLSDIEMPRMDGFDLLRRIRADARFSDLPVIVITSRIAQKHRDVAVELGANQYLGKPYAEDELLGWVARYSARLDAQAEPA